MEISEIVKIFRDKVVELQKFFKITDEPEAVYAHSFQFARALEIAADILSAENDREKIVVQLRKQWQDAEMFICSMCGHFDRKTDGNIVYGNQDCGEIVGYPYCKKFTPWIPASVRLPEVGGNYFVVVKYKYDFEKEYSYDADFAEFTFSDGYIDNCWNTYNDWNEGQQYLHITHWMPIPEPPMEGSK